MTITCAEERTLLGLNAGEPLPAGGITLTVTYRRGTGTASLLTDDLAPMLLERFGMHVQPGSANLWAGEPVSLPDPIHVEGKSRQGFACPIIIEEQAVGLVYRESDVSPQFLEVLASTQLSQRLKLKDGQQVKVRLLPGTLLHGNAAA